MIQPASTSSRPPENRIRHAGDIADWRLCLGCGACAFACTDQKIRLVDFVEEGIRPIVTPSDCGSCTACLDVCPAWDNDHTEINARPGAMRDLVPYCGPVLEIWEGHAVDPETRRLGASGGVITALSRFALEHEGVHGVLHIGSDPDDPTRNRTKMSRSTTELLERTGSRYAAASACDRLDLIAAAPAPCLFVGQPSEVTALRKAQRLRRDLDRNVALAISFFCAGSPSRQGTLRLLESLGVEPNAVRDLRYRGNGWPGHFAVKVSDDDVPPRRLTYAESWGFLQSYRPFSTQLSPDGTGEDADLSCGDPWYRPVIPGEAGSSLIVVRTEAGRAFLQRAIAAGWVELTPAEPWKLLQSQKNLLSKRGSVGGRIAALRLLGLPAPRLRGFELFANWRRLSVRRALSSVLGTMRRAVARRYHRPLGLRPPPQATPAAAAVSASRP